MSDARAARTLADAADEAHDGLERLLDAPVSSPLPAIDGVRVGTLVGFADDGATPLVTYAGQPTSAAVRARTTVDLHAAHIGRGAVLVFEDGNPLTPIVLGCLHAPGATLLAGASHQVEIDADGDRLLVSAKDRIVLRCGKASM